MRRTSVARRIELLPEGKPLAAPKLIVELEPAYEVFRGNLRDLFWPEKQPRLRVTSWPGKFWPDVFVQRPLPWRGFAQSVAVHILVIAVLLAVSQLGPQLPRAVQPAPFSSKDVVYYAASEYLPPLNTRAASKHVAQKGDPAHAPQPIISVPPEADNRTQTIVVPPKVRIDHEVPLPNLVAWSEAAPAVPLSATVRSTTDFKLPSLPAQVVAPSPEISRSGIDRTPMMLGSVVAPPPDVAPAFTRKLGDLNIGHSEAVAPAPQLAMTEQRMRSRGQPLENGAVVPPPPSTQGTTASSGRLIALGIHPAAPEGPVNPPLGNRRGTFAATPEGSAGAAGTPESKNGGSFSASTSGKSANGIPSGLQVGTARPANDSRLVADARQPHVGDVATRPPVQLSDNPTALEREVFKGKKSYSMTLNMPNLNSAGGSWVIHFAELKEGDEGNLAAPVAVQKVDPGYPMELMRHNIAGTVMLYAVIRSDGSVGDVRVLRGVDDRLDEYAKAALAHSRFSPATRNGTAVPLEAVVMIPFRPVRNKPAF